MSIFNDQETFDSLEVETLLCTADSSQLSFGQDTAVTTLDVDTSTNRTVSINSTPGDIDLVYVNSGSSIITDFSVQEAVNFTGSVTGSDITGTMTNLVVNSVGGISSSDISQSDHGFR
eukprot:Lithocolla_globosa_v1_NODE_93_length_6512_cov_4.841877.p9 type:complete len:118 gc:universal NODE_93_length_6512_cov_4.841877:5961-6314(+)